MPSAILITQTKNEAKKNEKYKQNENENFVKDIREAFALGHSSERHSSSLLPFLNFSYLGSKDISTRLSYLFFTLQNLFRAIAN